MKKVIYLFMITCILVSCLYVPSASAETLGDLKKKLAQFEENYNNNLLEQKMNEQQLNQIKGNINTINNNIYKAGIDIDKLKEDIAKNEEEIIANEKEIQEILAFVQAQNGESAYLEYAFGAKDFTDFIYRIAVSEQVTSYNEELINKANNKIEENKQKTKQLEQKKVDLANEQAKLKTESEKIQVTLSKLDEEEMSIADLIKSQKSFIKTYEDMGCKDNEDIDTCGRNMLPPDTSFWRPLTKGYIAGTLGLYGPRACTGNMSCFHKGMDLSIDGGYRGDTPIYSIANGVVVSIIRNRGCAGNKIYIQHNVNGTLYISGYLHMHEVNVKEGQRVTKDTQIGIMGGFESYDSCSTGAHLHLELSTGNFEAHTSKPYSSYRFNPASQINFPKSVSKYWYDRTTRF